MSAWFRPSRERRGPDPYLAAKVAIFVVGVVIAFLGIKLNRSWVISVAIAILLVGFVLRFFPRPDKPEE